MKLLACISLVWMSTMLCGFGILLRYAFTPGAAVLAPESWPATTRLVRPAGRPALVIFLHPRCACSRASLAELAQLLARDGARAAVYAVFLDPAGMKVGWATTNLWRAAAAIPGVTPVLDREGREAEIFHSGVSGEVRLYDAAGALAYQGGITESRGHEGDNAGRTALATLLAGGVPERTAAPVFGCALFAAHPLEGARP